MTTLLDEVLEELKKNNKKPEDVEYVMSLNIPFKWSAFEDKACLAVRDEGTDNYIYEEDLAWYDYKNSPVEDSLKIIGKDWWLERVEEVFAIKWRFVSLSQNREMENDMSVYYILR